MSCLLWWKLIRRCTSFYGGLWLVDKLSLKSDWPIELRAPYVNNSLNYFLRKIKCIKTPEPWRLTVLLHHHDGWRDHSDKSVSPSSWYQLDECIKRYQHTMIMPALFASRNHCIWLHQYTAILTRKRRVLLYLRHYLLIQPIFTDRVHSNFDDNHSRRWKLTEKLVESVLYSMIWQNGLE